MHLAEQISTGANTLPDLRLMAGIVVGVVVTLVWHIISRIRRMFRTMALLAVAGGVGASSGVDAVHQLLANWLHS